MKKFTHFSLFVLLLVVCSHGLSLEAAERSGIAAMEAQGVEVVAAEPTVAAAQEAVVHVSEEAAAQGTLDENMDTVFDAAAQARIEKDLNKISTRCCMGISTVAGWASTLLLGSSVVLWGAQKIAPMVSTVPSDSFLTRSAGYPLKIVGAAVLCGLVSYLFDKRYLKAQIRACEIHEELKNNGFSLDEKRAAVSVLINELFTRWHPATMKFSPEGEQEKKELALNIHACMILRAQFN